MLCLPPLFSQIIYVKEGAHGNGSSWEKAYGDLQIALSFATPGSQIWVAEGAWFPVNCEVCSEYDRTVSFEIPTGVSLFGGFAGNETSFKQRNWKAHPTTLSGNIGREDQLDNSRTVVFTRHADEKTILDGFIIADGYADATTKAGDPGRAGAGWYNEGAGQGNRSNPQIYNCVFLNNYAQEGAAIFNNGTGGESSLVLVNCIFSGNKALYGGAGIFINGTDGKNMPVLERCQFVNNEAAFGAGIFSACTNLDNEPSIKECSFVNNKAKQGSGLFFLGMPEAPSLRSNKFLNNYSSDGEDIFVVKSQQMPGQLMSNIRRKEHEN
jgi:hypothetical protein